MKTFIRMLKDESGASAAEYALILAIVGSAIAVAAVALGNTIAGAMDRASNCIDEAPSGTTATCTTAAPTT
jgi:pilus assembly protein Flp/PilA